MTAYVTLNIELQDGTRSDIIPSGQLAYYGELAYSRHGCIKKKVKLIALEFVEAILSAASEGGYTQSDILHTLLSKCDHSQRVLDMAEAACVAAGTDRLAAIFDRIRFD